MLLSNLKYVDKNFSVKTGSIETDGEKLCAFSSAKGGTDMEGLLAMPGFIDIHTHGGDGVDWCDKDENKLQKLTMYYAKRGVTSVCPTTMTLPESELRLVLEAIEKVKGNESGAYIHGINMEGPYISYEKRGAQNPEYIRPADEKEFERLSGVSKILLVDLAPETEGALSFSRSVCGSAVCSVAHTCATFEQTVRGFESGFTHATHLFNAMTALESRSPGVVGAVFASDRVTAELICDGFHLAPETVKLSFKILGSNRAVAISDSLSSAGCADGEYMLGGQKVIVKNARAHLEDGTIAGSTTNLFDEFRNLLSFSIPFADALAACTINPAKVIGADSVCGSLEEGKNADIVFVDSSMNLKHVMIKGKLIY